MKTILDLPSNFSGGVVVRKHITDGRVTFGTFISISLIKNFQLKENKGGRTRHNTL